MKKTISINISGIIFHIEEDGYESLKKYLDSIHAYFGTFDDSSEILSDIESRIAELFLARLTDGKQVITADDVEALRATMGNVSDFKAAEDGDDAKQADTTSHQQHKQTDTGRTAPPKRLFRDGKRKILGGIGAGLAHYFSIDPVWPRLILALLALGSSGVGFILYIILWIVLPVAENLEDEPTVRKMFRDPANKVLGGVASGVALFFGTDTALIRVLFVVTALLGGFGFLIYIILWFSLPEAKSITDKIQMQGEPVTLSSIDNNIKKGEAEKTPTEEGPLAKVVLFPFRLLATVITAVGKFLGPLLRGSVDILRVAVGLTIALFGLLAIVALVMGLGIAAGIFASPEWSWMQGWNLQASTLPLDALRNTFSGWLLAAAFLTALIPLIVITLLGISAIARKVVFNAYVGWGLFVLFFISVGLLSFLLPAVIYGFKEEATYKTEQVFQLNAKTPVLEVREVGLDDYKAMDLEIKPYSGTTVKVINYFRSQGRTKKDALQHARAVRYTISQNDSVLTFDSNLQFPPQVPFRAQRLDVEIFIPEKQSFVIDAALWPYIDNRYRLRGEHNESTHRFRFENGEMICEDCPDTELPTNTGEVTPHPADYEVFTDFEAIDVRGLAEVRIGQADSFDVRITGPEELKEKYELSVIGETLVIDYQSAHRFFRKRKATDTEKVKIRISMPRLRDLEVSGAGEVYVNGFKEEEIDIELSGAVKLDGSFNAQHLTLEISGASAARLRGRGEYLEADITGASSLKAFDYAVQRALVEAHGASHASVFATEEVEISKGVASSVSTRGGGQVTERN